jgi:cullin-associated NEDD8-dissociated protein 1
MISLFVLGEIGRDIDMSSLGDIQTIISTAFTSPSENVKKAAAFALGNVSAGNAALYLPDLIAEIRTQPAHCYLLLHALKELVSCKASTPTGSQALITFVKEIWDLLFEYSTAEDEGTRSVVAECIGKIVLVDAEKHLPELVKHLHSDSPAMRCTMVQAFKITASSKLPGIDDLLRPLLLDFFKLVSDPDLNVRRIALVSFNSAVHIKPHLVKPILEQVVPMLYVGPRAC